MNEYKIICRYKAGSYAAELNNATSDVDWRGVYLTQDLSKVMALHPGRDSIGPVISPPIVKPHEETVDASFFELRHFLNMLKDGNTAALDLVFNDKWDATTEVFANIQKNRRYLINPEGIYYVTRGYAASEYKLALGKTTGKLGSKRQEAVAKYNYSPKNMANLFRIIQTATLFFDTGEYHLSLKQPAPFTHALLREIRESPERLELKFLTDSYNIRMAAFEEMWAKNQNEIKKNYRYQEDIAAQIVAAAYLPIIEDHLHIGWFHKLNSLIHAFVINFPK